MKSYSFELGEFSCIAVSDGGVNYPIGSFAQGVPVSDLGHVLSIRDLPTSHIFTPYTCLYIDTGKNKVLIDTGLGPSMASHVQNWFPHVDNSQTVAGTLADNMHLTGIEAAEIDTVIVTHAHPDHIGGNLDTGGEVMYPNASYYISQEEWDFWSSDERTSDVPQSFVVTAREFMEPVLDKLSFVVGETEIVPGISVVPTPGHTPGHMSVAIQSGGKELLHLSDAVLHPLHLEYTDWVLAFDILPEQSLVTRRNICERAAQSNSLIFAHHFPPFPNLGHIVANDDGWRWKPIEAVD